MRNLFSRVSMLLALFTMLVGSSTAAVENSVNATENPELIKFLAPIVAGLLGKLMELIFKARFEKKRIAEAEKARIVNLKGGSN